MFKNIVISFALVFLIAEVASAQGAMDLFNTSRFARPIRLGNAYAGVAEGPETIFYNAAGLADQTSYSFIFSKGQGFGFFIDDPSAFDYALVVPLGSLGTAALNINSLSFNIPPSDKINHYIYGISFAKELLPGFSMGTTLNYYRSVLNFVFYSFELSQIMNKEATGWAIDANVSALYRMPSQIKLSERDKFQVGVQVKNLLNSKFKYKDFPQEDLLFQNIRLGISYSYDPGFDYIYGLSPLKFMGAFDAVFMGQDYKYYEWQPNYGLELSLFEILQLSYGRENEIQIKESYSYSPQHPVNRYGFGLNIPFHKLFETSYEIKLAVNYSISDWQKIDEKNGSSQFVSINRSIENKAFSVGLGFGF
jgi:hypothetical protein